MAAFSSTGTDRTPADQAPTATKLMWPNESTPEFPTKTYSATTMTTAIKRVDEVDLRLALDERADHAREDDKRDWSDPGKAAASGHARSAIVGGANRPPGRTSRTRMTSPNTTEGRYWLCAVGSAPPSRPAANPIENPPSVAGQQPIHPADDDPRQHDDRLTRIRTPA